MTCQIDKAGFNRGAGLARGLLCVLLCLSVLTQPAWAKKKKSSSKSKQNQRAYLEDLIALHKEKVEKAAEVKAAAEQKVARLRAQLDTAQQNYSYGGSLAEQKATEIASTGAAREAAEERVLAAQESDSLYHRLRKSLDASKQAFADVRSRLVESSAYKATLKPASGLAAAARQAASSPTEYLRSQPEYVKAEREYRAAETVFNQHRSSLFAEDADWMTATSTARQILPQLAEDRALLDAARRKISGLKIAVRSTSGLASDAEEDLKASKAAIASAEKALKAAGGKVTKKPSDSSSPSSSSRTNSSDGAGTPKK